MGAILTNTVEVYLTLSMTFTGFYLLGASHHTWFLMLCLIFLFVTFCRKNERWETIKLLLTRGANPNVCSVPMPALVFTIKAGDIEATRLLLLKGADANLRLADKVPHLSIPDLSPASNSN